MLPASVSALLAGAPIVGFSGSRTPAPASIAALRMAARVVSPAVPIVVGCAAGIDQHVAQLIPRAEVIRASSFGIGRAVIGLAPLSPRAQLAARSIAVVQACVGGVWVSSPATACPPSVQPARSSSACFNGSGSGTWASLAYAIGSGIAPLVFLPAGIVPPAAFCLVAAGQGWYVASDLGWSPAPPAGQLTLF
jgi:hypothetical protein